MKNKTSTKNAEKEIKQSLKKKQTSLIKVRGFCY